MIRVRARGHIGTALGKAEFVINRDEMKVKEVLKVIISSSKLKLSPPAVLIAVNGVEISALDQEDTVVKSGDEIVLIPVSHGG
ncbi:MAG: MoaD/ThiS family protein [Candidatus Methylarchaceae archaeon HK01B]|nr:MoaD/ThiS family protein [Candidatus Methylarchaceae archaeon HK02M1]MCP8318372.1 MoaD/ThiS family protein [Candidatus Methylarchaceae archaeon HK01B]